MAFHKDRSNGESVKVGPTKYTLLKPLQAVFVTVAILCLSLLFLRTAQAGKTGVPPGYLYSMYLLTILSEPELQNDCALLFKYYYFTAYWRSYSDPTYSSTTHFYCAFSEDGKANCAGYDGTWTYGSNDYFRLEIKSSVYSYHVVYSGTVTPRNCNIEGTMNRLDAPDYHGTFTAYESTPP